ncbi:hypothetical protein OUZ56_029409 [Daphnia magna]|uniref:Uncharacterized protein n=1 Tax=Daphnia magna TaxID=35525 RepID=A0ABR0B6R7_9CRUS|nr:hypothetical protein OUZ56_029409 [Daphnia magna]
MAASRNFSLKIIWAWSPQIPVRSLSCPVHTFNRSMYESVRILSRSPRKICQKILGQSAGESPQFLLSASAFYPGPSLAIAVCHWLQFTGNLRI